MLVSFWVVSWVNFWADFRSYFTILALAEEAQNSPQTPIYGATKVFVKNVKIQNAFDTRHAKNVEHTVQIQEASSGLRSSCASTVLAKKKTQI